MYNLKVPKPDSEIESVGLRAYGGSRRRPHQNCIFRQYAIEFWLNPTPATLVKVNVALLMNKLVWYAWCKNVCVLLYFEQKEALIPIILEPRISSFLSFLINARDESETSSKTTKSYSVSDGIMWTGVVRRGILRGRRGPGTSSRNTPRRKRWQTTASASLHTSTSVSHSTIKCLVTKLKLFPLRVN